MSRGSSLSFVSIIIPIYNDPVGIKSSLKSLVNQTHPQDAYEIIVADNGSTDETRQVVEQFQEQYPDLIHLVVEDQIQSSYAARNRGIRAATGDTLAFTDADCVPEATWLEAGVRALEERTAACGGGRIVFIYQSDRANVYEYFDSARKLNQQSYVENAGFAATANFFACQELFEKYGPFRSDLISGGDYEFGRRVTKAGEKMIYIPDAIVQHPARSTFKAIYVKSKRVALGQKQLEKSGLLEHSRLSIRQLYPVRFYPVDERWSGSLSRLEKAQLIFLQNFFRWRNFLIRIR